MKYLIIAFLLVNSTAITAQFDTLNTSVFYIGVSVQPVLSLANVRNIEDFSFLPNLELSYGTSVMSANISIGAICKIGFRSYGKWTYAGANYTINTMSKDFVQHGPEISLGFNCFLGAKKMIRFSIGSSISMVLVSENNLKVVLRPFIVGLSFNLLK